MPIFTGRTIKQTTFVLSLPAVAFISFHLMDIAFEQKAIAGPETVKLAGAPVTYRLAGEYLNGQTPADAPTETLSKSPDVEIMRLQVSSRDYANCVKEHHCEHSESGDPGSMDIAQTGVSFEDAVAFARWLSNRTGETWRLPTDREWALAAGSLYTDDGLGIASDPNNPSVRWLAVYRREARQSADPDPVLRPQGSFGFNENGVGDLNGNVWEWTSTCYQRVTLAANGKVLNQSENCGVRTIEGKHRTYMTSFLRQGKDGGCSTGSPPDHLGFRLVREKSFAPFRNLVVAVRQFIS